VEEGFDGELGRREGLGDEIVAAMHFCLRAGVEVVDAGDKNDGHFAAVSEAADFAAEIEAGQLGHEDIEQDEIETILPADIECESW